MTRTIHFYYRKQIFCHLKMLVKCCMLLSLLQLAYGLTMCPDDCACNTDMKGRLQIICKGLKTIPVQSLDPSIQVLVISSSKNPLTISPIFIPFTKLEVLQINEANIQSIGVHSFWGVQSLRLLDLSRNNISTILANNFRGQDGLHELDLSFNKIQEIASWTFQHLKDLRRLNLAENLIVELVPRVFYMLGKLKYLSLSGNPLNDLPPDVFKDILELKELQCRNCNIKKINPQVYNLLQRLEFLDLGDNQLKYLEKGEFRDLNLIKSIKLDGNQLSVIIDNLFETQKYLAYLDLSRNRLAKVTNGAFVNLSNLTYLDLSYNKLVKLESASVEPLRKLHTLNISGNIQMDLYDIREAFQLLHNLKTLSIADMGVIPYELLVPLGQLKALNLSGNHLVNVSMQILQPVDGLELLDISRNQLNGIEDSQAVMLQKIKEVRLENNPLICDRCHMGALIQMAKNLRWSLHPICFLPESLRGIQISDLTIGSLDVCTAAESLHDETFDAASTSHNFLTRGNLNVLAFLGGVFFILISLGIFITVVCFAGRKRHNRQNSVCATDKKRDISIEMETSLDMQSVAGTESSFKYPKEPLVEIEDQVCTIENLFIPPPPPPPSSIVKITTRTCH
ncbi:insulin-like growth factor-binding protein complex acid labile subunit isoform X2 [Sitodiplosis mosellana]|nr:insulin-like growth factor-binding protein complex acid labile subunit isoform X2 [Sitodiplosis mosellana]XP_055294992.1 insulin-like growth factor-binding protein complex acid labile subunit isoform X2 [Sitodiplosis mosellana]XP_055294993.1 insulin-like growth factor-binding protein complex acid labile subunit isoform X2 [Sitodiplosis mosellana]